MFLGHCTSERGCLINRSFFSASANSAAAAALQNGSLLSSSVTPYVFPFGAPPPNCQTQACLSLQTHSSQRDRGVLYQNFANCSQCSNMSFHVSSRQEAVGERLHNVHCICCRQYWSLIECKCCDFLCSVMIFEVAVRTTEEGHSSQFHTVLLMARSVSDSRTKVPRCHDERIQLHERPSHFYGTDCSKACACHGPYAPQKRERLLSPMGSCKRGGEVNGAQHRTV